MAIQISRNIDEAIKKITINTAQEIFPQAVQKQGEVFCSCWHSCPVHIPHQRLFRAYTKHKCLPPLSGSTCHCHCHFKRHARRLGCRFLLLASEGAGPISKWTEPHVIPSKTMSRDLIWKAEEQPAQDALELGDFIQHWCHYWLRGGTERGREVEGSGYGKKY